MYHLAVSQTKQTLGGTAIGVKIRRVRDTVAISIDPLLQSCVYASATLLPLTLLL